MSKRELLVVLPLVPSAMAQLESQYTLHKLWLADDREALLASVGDAVSGVVTDGHAGAGEALLGKLPHCEVVSVFGVGVDAVNLDYCRERGIRVGNTPDVLTEEVADFTIGLCIATYRQMINGDRYVRDGSWQAKGNMQLTRRFYGRKVGIFGMGRIGQAIARRLEASNCSIDYHNRNPLSDCAYRYHDSLVGLAQSVDCLICSVSPVPSMRGMIDRTVLSALGTDGVLINVSRGLIIDEPQLVEALANGTIAAAGLDVFDAEPYVPPALFEMDNVVLQPHAASATVETRDAMGQLVVDNLAQCFTTGEPVCSVV